MHKIDATKTRWAWLSVMVGLVAAVVTIGSEQRSRGVLPADAIAQVGNAAIARADWLRAVNAVESDLKRPLEAHEQRRVLDRLIDEELLLQEALQSNLPRDEPSIRKLLVATMTAGITAQFTAARVTDAEAEALFEASPNLFSSEQLQLAAAQAPANTALDAAAMTATLCTGAQPMPPPWQRIELPSGPLAAAKLADYLGASLTDVARSAPTSQLSGPHRLGPLDIVLCIRRRERLAPAYAEVAAAVRETAARQAADQALAAFIDRARRGNTLHLAADVPAPGRSP